MLQGIAELDQKIEEAAAEHPDFFIFESLPGADAVMATRLLAAFGFQRDRYRCPDELQTHSGIPPVDGAEWETEMAAFSLGPYDVESLRLVSQAPC